METGKLHRLGGEAKPSTLMFAKFAPDGQTVAYVRENNLYVESIATGEITQLTADGGEKIINGTSDWVYEEEFHLRDGFCWSPDGRYIAYWQFDTTGIKPFYMINNTDSLYPKLIPLPYPKVGTTNAACRVGVISALGGETTWFDVPGDPRNHYIPKMAWAAALGGNGHDSSRAVGGEPAAAQLLIQQLNRLQNKNRIMLGDIHDGSASIIFTEEDEAWIDLHDGLKWFDEGRAFTWLSDRDGWRHIYRCSRDGREVQLLTPGEFDVIRLLAIDEQEEWVLFPRLSR